MELAATLPTLHLPLMVPKRKRGRPRKNVIGTTTPTTPTTTTVAQTTSTNNSTMERSKPAVTASSLLAVDGNSTMGLNNKPRLLHNSNSSSAQETESVSPVKLNNSTNNNEGIQSHAISGSTAPTMASKRDMSSLLSSPPPRSRPSVRLTFEDDLSDEDAIIFVDPLPQPKIRLPLVQHTILEETSMPPPLQPQTPKRSSYYNTHSPFSQPRSHVDPTMLFNNTSAFNVSSVLAPSSSPPKSSSSFMFSSPSTPKTFSNIISSSPLYPYFRSSPVHGTSPSRTPKLLPLLGGSAFPLISSSRPSRPVLAKPLEELPKLDFEALARGGIRKQRGAKNKGHLHHSRRGRQTSLRSTARTPEMSLYQRRRAFLNSRRDRHVTASSPIVPGTPKFSDALHFSPRPPLDLKRGLNLFVDASLRSGTSSDVVGDSTGSPRKRSSGKPVFQSLASAFMSSSSSSSHLPKPRQISLSIGQDGRAVIKQEFASPPRRMVSAQSAPPPAPPAVPADTFDSRYESSEEEDDEDEEDVFEMECDDDSESEPEAASPTPKRSLRSSFSSPLSFRNLDRGGSFGSSFSHSKDKDAAMPLSSMTSSPSPFNDRRGGSSSKLMSSPMAGLQSPMSLRSPSSTTHHPHKLKNLDSVFPKLQSPYLKSSRFLASRSESQMDSVSEVGTEADTDPDQSTVSNKSKGPKPIDARKAFVAAVLSSQYYPEDAKQQARLLQTPPRGGYTPHLLHPSHHSSMSGSTTTTSTAGFAPPFSPGYPASQAISSNLNMNPNQHGYAMSTPRFEDFMFENFDEWVKSPSKF